MLYAALIQASDASFYGTSYAGGASGVGTVFKMNPTTGALTPLHNFSGSPGDGAYPNAGLIQASDGNLYGTTSADGASLSGTVFRINPTTGMLTLLHSFSGGVNDGAVPSAAALIQASDGNLYGTTRNGGASGNGTAFRMNPTTGTLTLLHPFAGYPGDGSDPNAALIQASDGNLYGTTNAGGASNLGTVFRMNPTTGAVMLLHNFTGYPGDGAHPNAALMQATDGNLYGTTQGGGGASGNGVVFCINPTTGVLTLLHSFTGSTGDGAHPDAALIQASDGNLYGTTYSGGASGNGTVFQMNPTDGVLTLLHSFTGSTGDGANPWGSLIQASDGNFYGTTLYGGSSSAGTVFKIIP
jgi:uncharacterized repeat protein (TIGR03803 family)